MSDIEMLLLLFTAIIAGTMNSVAGGGTFLTFPVLIFTGMSPTIANITSTIALWPGSLASVSAYRRELSVHKKRLPGLVGISLVGGVIGAILLLLTPEVTFAAMVPYLLLAATLIFTFGRPLTSWLRKHIPHSERSVKWLTAGSFLLQFAIALYGGFFGAGIGILMLAMLQLLGLQNIHEMNALKTLLATCINGIAVITFIVAGAIAWPQALLMTAGAILGGYGGAHYALKLPPEKVRWIVIIIGMTMTAYFFFKAS